VQVDLALAETMPLLPLNAVTIEQVFVNLLRNAIEAQAQTIQVITTVTATAVCCSVHDDGRGLTAEERQHLFDPFFTTRRHAGGTGLGLSLTYTIIAAHHGTIDVDSLPGGGTTIWVRLPVPLPLPGE
jgi:signal transduction histidine kinase